MRWRRVPARPRRQAWRSAGRRGMQSATRRDSEADGDTGLWRHCRAYVEMEWCVPTAEKLSGIATPTCTSPPRPRAHARTDKKVMLAASQVRAGAVIAIANRYLRVRPADTWFRSRIGRQDKGDSGRGGRATAGVGGAPVHCALRSDVTAANMLTWEPVCSDDGPFHARIREAAALMLVRL